MKRMLIFALGMLVSLSTFALAASEDAVLRAREGAANLLRGKYKEAIVSFDTALRSSVLADVRRANVLNDRGVAKWRLKMTKEAIADFNKSIELFPDYAIVYNNRGNALMDLGEPEQAILDFSRAIELAPGYGAAFNNRGNAQLVLQRKEEALKDFRKAIAQQPELAHLYHARGSAYARTKRYNFAIKDLSKAISLDSDSVESYRERGAVFLKIKQLDKAREDLSMALILDPDDTDALVGRANTYLLLGSAEDGLVDVDKALSSKPANAKALGVRGQIYEALGRPEEAVNDYKAALEADPLQIAARIRLQKMGIAPPPPPKRQSIDKPVKGWWVSQTPEGYYIATNHRFPKVRVRLEMYGEGKPEILDWMMLKYSLQGIGLLRYNAGVQRDDSSKSYDYTAIIDLWQGKVVAVEPHAWGQRKARWDWKMASVIVTDPDGVANEVTLRKAPSDSFGQGDQFWFNDGWWSEGGRPPPRPRPRRRQPSGGLFDWLFN